VPVGGFDNVRANPGIFGQFGKSALVKMHQAAVDVKINKAGTALGFEQRPIGSNRDSLAHQLVQADVQGTGDGLNGKD